MKKEVFLIGSIFLLFFAQNTFSQNCKQLVYEQVIDIHASLEPDQQKYKAMIPETLTRVFELTFNQKEARLKKGKDKEGAIKVMTSGTSTDAYFDLEGKMVKSFIQLDGDEFYAEEEMNVLGDLKALDKNKMILGYSCKAFETDDGEYKVWISNDLPNYLSPITKFVTEGAILRVEGEFTYYEAVKLKDDVNCDLLKYTKGQKVSTEQMEDLQEEKDS